MQIHRIMVITNHSYMLYRFRRELIEKLQERYEVILCMPFVGHEEDFQRMGLRCINTPMERRGTNPVTEFKLLRTYAEILKRESPDLVITYAIKPNIYAGLICGRRGIPFYANVQGLGTAFQKKTLSRLVTCLYRLTFRRVEKVFFENYTNAEEFLKRGIILEGQGKVLPGAGVNLEHYVFTPYPDHEMIHFLYSGRIMREKGMEELFRASERLHREGYAFALDLVGFFEEEYREKIKYLQDEGVVLFHGFTPEPRPFYAAADCVVLPSYHEGMSNVLLEAAATGRPVITSNISGCREAVQEGRTGFLCKARDEDSLYEAMRQFLQLPKQTRAEMGRAAREKIEREFDRNTVVQETLAAMGLQAATAETEAMSEA